MQELYRGNSSPKAKGKIRNWVSSLQVWASDKVLRSWIPDHFSWFLRTNDTWKGHPDILVEIIRFTDMLKDDENNLRLSLEPDGTK